MLSLRCFVVVATAFTLSARAARADDFTTSDRYGGHLTDGFVFNNNRWGEPVDNGSLTIKTSAGLFSYWTTHSADNACCSAPYAGIGTIGGQGKEWTSDQYGQPGSHLPIMLKNIEALKSSWRFKVPVPTSSHDQYHIYYELYICDNTQGLRGKGNIAIGVWDNEFYHQSYKGGKYGTREDVNGTPMDVQFSANPFGQGDFWVVESPTGTYTPDATGVITVNGFDIKKVIDWAIGKGTYNPEHYLTELNLAYEVMTLPGKTLTTEHASFCVKAKGTDLVTTPPWTSTEWGPGCTDGSANATGTDAGSSEAGSSHDAGSAVGMGEEATPATTGGGSTMMPGDVEAGAAPSSEVSPPASESGGCGCRLARSSSGIGRGLWGLGALLFATARRRRSHRRRRCRATHTQL